MAIRGIARHIHLPPRPCPNHPPPPPPPPPQHQKPPRPPPRPTFNIKPFGATGDGTTKDPRALQKALDTCAVSGGGDVLVPAGNYLIGSIQLGNRTTLRFEKGAILTGSPDTADYPSLDI